MAWTESLEPIIPNDCASSRAPLLEHPQIIREGFRVFIASEVPTGIVFRFEHDIWPEAPNQEVTSTYYYVVHHTVPWMLDFHLGSLESSSDSSVSSAPASRGVVLLCSRLRVPAQGVPFLLHRLLGLLLRRYEELADGLAWKNVAPRAELGY